MATDIRLRAAETFAVHGRVIDWQQARSPDRVPAAAVGLNRPTLALMRWATQGWARMHRVNRMLGTAGASLQLDLWPAYRSAAMFAIRRVPGDEEAAGVSGLRHGMALQRFWLTATKLGLGLQPALATLIFADYGSTGARFTRDDGLVTKAEALARAFETNVGPVREYVFAGRVGQLRPGLPGARSTRRRQAVPNTGA